MSERASRRQGRREKHRRGRTRRPGRGLVLAASAALVAAIVVVAVVWRAFSDQNTVGTPTSPAQSSASAVFAEQVSSCQRSLKAADGLVRAARPSADDWRAYTDARTKYVLDKTLDQRQARAKQAAVAAAGPGHLQGFDAAARSYSGVERDCDAFLGSTAPDPRFGAPVQRCRERVDLARTAVDRARLVVGYWREQVDRLQQVRSGKTDAGAAQRAFEQAWRTQVTSIDDYALAAQRLADAPACQLSGVSTDIG